jgi:membrane protease YdiL (CAAX protease family)
MTWPSEIGCELTESRTLGGERVMNEPLAPERKEVNWKQVGIFLALTFGLTWILDLVLWFTVGYGESPLTGLLLQLQMLLPAFCAIVLGLFVFKGNALYQVRTNKERPRWFYYYFLVYTIIYAVTSTVALVTPNMTTLTALGAITQALTLLGLILLIALRVASGRKAYARAGLLGGKVIYWLVFGVGFVAFYAAQTGLNILFRLGERVNVSEFLSSLPAPQAQAMPPDTFLLVTALQGVLLAPFVALLLGFGEEYGWRGYLQGELIRLGKVKGILLLGVIWGVWHAPVILMGHNYPGYPVAGVFLMIGYTIGLAFVLGYAVLKSGSVLLAAYLHALNNQVLSLLIVLVYKPANPVFSFGAGLFGVLSLGVVVILILLLDPLWRE